MNQVTTVSISAGAGQTNIFSATGGLGNCFSLATQLVPVLSDMPTANATLSSYLAEVTQTATITNPCEVPVITGSMAGEYTSYISNLESWASKHKTDIESLLAACSNVPEISTAMDSYPNVTSMCSDYTWAKTKKTTTTKHKSKTTATSKTTASETTTSEETTSTASEASATAEASSSATQAIESASSTVEGKSAAETIGSGAAPQQVGMAITAAGMAGLIIALMY